MFDYRTGNNRQYFVKEGNLSTLTLVNTLIDNEVGI